MASTLLRGITVVLALFAVAAAESAALRDAELRKCVFLATASHALVDKMRFSAACDSGGAAWVRRTEADGEIELCGGMAAVHLLCREGFGLSFSLGRGFQRGSRLPSEHRFDLAQKASSFDVLGLHPFHDFPEGPDWWSRDAYKQMVAGVGRLGGNMLALHTYPYSRWRGTGTNEPTVWVGSESLVADDGRIAEAGAYETSYANSMRGEWGYTPKPASQYALGMQRLFGESCENPVQDSSDGSCPYPGNATQQLALFDRTLIMLRDAFRYGEQMGVGGTVGTEAPLAFGKAQSAQDAYAGIIKRILKSGLPLAYYWIWTPEMWEWEHVNSSSPLVAATLADLAAAQAAWSASGATFQLATCGWVLGPLDDRSLLDTELDSNWTISSLDMNVGRDPVDPAYANITRHKKWVIPWMEDDPGLLAPELWVGRTIEHVAAARSMNVTGLLGIHWRTHTTEPTIRALFEAAYNPALTVGRFYSAWTRETCGVDAGALFVKIDSFALPRPCDWIQGPGSIVPQSYRPSHYTFVEEFCSLNPAASSSDFQRENHRSWCEMFRFHRAVAQTGAAYLAFNTSWSGYLASPSHTRALEALEKRVSLVERWSEAGAHLLNYLDSPGDLGSVMNLQSLNAGVILDQPGVDLAKALGVSSLPPNATLSLHFPRKTQSRLVVPVTRDLLEHGESMGVEALWIASDVSSGLQLLWRSPAHRHQPPSKEVMTQAGSSNVFASTLSPGDFSGADFEYCVCSLDACSVRWPPGSDWEYVAVAKR